MTTVAGGNRLAESRPLDALWLAGGSLAVVVGALLRFRTVGQTFFMDELWVVDVVRAGRYAPHAMHMPPLFFFLELAMSKICGIGEVCLRIVPAAAGVALSAAPLLTRRWMRPFDSPAIAAFSAVFLSFSSPLLFYSARAKQYTLEALLSFALVVAFARTMETGRVRTYATMCAAFLVVSYTTAFTIAGTGTALIVSAALNRDWGRTARMAAVHSALLAIFTAAYVGWMKPGPAVTARVGNLDRFFTNGPVLRFFDGSFAFVRFNTSHWLGEYLNLTRGLLLLSFASVIAGGTLAWRNGKRDVSAALACAAFLPPVVVLGVSALHLYPYGEVRLMAFAVPAVLLVVAAAWGEIAAASRIAALLLAVTASVFAYRGAALDPYNSSYMNIHDARVVYDAINKRHPQGTPLFARDWEWGPLTWYCRTAAADLHKLPGDATGVMTLAPEFWTVARTGEPLVVGRARCEEIATENDLVLQRCSQ